MVKAGTDNLELCDLITQLVGSVWKEERVPQEWVDAILIPILKKGNLRCCYNWRGILYWKWSTRLWPGLSKTVYKFC